MPAATTSTKPAKSEAKKKIATRTGLVDSDKRPNTRRVIVQTLSTHPKYGKIMRSRTILHIHDEKNESSFGDLVEVAACKPISKTKRWKLIRIVQKGVGMKFEGVQAPDTDGNAPAPATPAKAPVKPGSKPAAKALAKPGAKKSQNPAKKK